MNTSFDRIAAEARKQQAAKNARTPAELRDALNAIVEEFKALDPSRIADNCLVPLAQAVKAVAEYGTTVHAQIELRAIANNAPVPGAAVKDAVVHRAWHDQASAEQLARETFGDKAFTCALKSPAQIEKLPGGDVFVAVAAYKPPAGKKVVY
jgi:hypothetical protein